MYQYFSRIVAILILYCLTIDCNIVFGKTLRRSPNQRKTSTETTNLGGRLANVSAKDGNKAQSSTSDADEDWDYIMRNLQKYRLKNFTNIHVSFFSLQLFSIAKIAFDNRKEKGGWAGDFTRYIFVYEVEDIAERQDYWSRASSQEEREQRLKDFFPVILNWAVKVKKEVRLNRENKFKQKTEDLEQVLGVFLESFGSLDLEEFVEEQIEGQVKGLRHLEEHLKPAFYKYIYQELSNVVSKYPNHSSNKKTGEAFKQALLFKMREIRDEHNQFIKESVIPTVQALFYVSERNWIEKAVKPKWTTYNYWASKEALDVIPSQAKNLRIEAFNDVLQELYRKNLVQVEDINEIISVLKITKNDDGLGK